jgi:NAD-dependent deacetylase sirtuin 5
MEVIVSSTNEERFQITLRSARKVAVLTGAGVSAESGIPTFRGAGGLWRQYEAQSLATQEAWQKDPGLVWEFFDSRRKIARDAAPNPAHIAFAELEARWRDAGGTFTLLTQNIDGLHERAGSRNVVRLHGSLWQVRCIACGEASENHDVPITPAFAGDSSPVSELGERRFAEAELPHCRCGGVLRPNVIWFGESIASKDLVACADAIDKCALLIVAGTSAVVYPAAGLVPLAKRYGTVIADVNVEPNSVSELCDLVFTGRAGEILPTLLDVAPAWS